MFWVNGELASTISLSDRSFQYGDGCFTTILTKGGEVQHWLLHVQRMQSCLDLLGISIPDWVQVKLWVDAAALTDPYAGVKLHISRGEGGRGYNPVCVTEPTVTISHFSYPTHYLDWQKNGFELGVCQHKLGIMPMLAGHKHNNRIEQVVLRGELAQSGFQDGVVLDINEHVIETTMANLFWRINDTWFTPSLDTSGVAGVIRKLVIQEAYSSSIELNIGRYPLEDIMKADEVFATNAILGIAPVVQINGAHFRVGAQTRSFQESLNS